MNWKCETKISSLLQAVSAISWFVLLLALYMQNLALSFISLSFILIHYSTRWYLQKMPTHLKLENEQTLIKLFQGEDSEIKFLITNGGKLPVWNSVLRFSLEPIAVAESAKVFEESSSKITYSLPLSLSSAAVKTVAVPIHAKHRGTTKISSVELVVHDLFGFGSTTCKLSIPMRCEILIFPQLKEVRSGKELSTLTPGTNNIEHSMYENLAAPAGAREYVSSDSFNRVHWKASARTSQLMTKQYERSIEMKWIMILDVSVKRYSMPQISKQFEHYISQAAFLCEEATQRGFAFELHINLDPGGPTPYMILQAGEGRAHLRKALELLSRIGSGMSIVSPFRMTAMLKKRLSNKGAIVLRVGENRLNEGEAVLFQGLEKTGSKCFEVVTTEDGAFLRKLVKGEVR